MYIPESKQLHKRFDKITPKILDFLRGKSFQSTQWITATFILLSAYFIVILLTFQDYGITYDEFWRFTYGNAIINWFVTGFRDTTALTYIDLYYNGGFFNVIQQIAAKISPMGVYETRHLVNALCGLLALIGAYKVGKLVFNPFVGFLSVLFLAVSARFYGHIFNNPIDIPFATVHIFAIYYLIKFIHQLPKPSKSTTVFLGITIGLTVGMRVGGFILFFYLGLGMFLVGLYSFLKLKGQGETGSFKEHIIKPAALFLVIGFIAYVVMLIWWPAAQVNPIKQPIKSILYTPNFPYSFNVFFDGKMIPSSEMPWYYLPKWLLISLPEFYLIALAGGLAAIAGIKPKKYLSILRDQKNIGLLILGLSAIFPVIYTILTKPVDYDEMRHFLFIIPPLSIIAAFSVALFLQRSRLIFINAILPVVILASLILTTIDMVKLHPDQYIYFNRLFGKGVAQASKSYEMDYWGNSLKEAVEWITKNYQVKDNNQKVKVASCLQSLSTSYYLRDDRFEYIGTFDDGQPIQGTPDLFLASPRWGCDKKFDGEVLYIVTKMGAPLSKIIEIPHNGNSAGN